MCLYVYPLLGGSLTEGQQLAFVDIYLYVKRDRLMFVHKPERIDVDYVEIVCDMYSISSQE